MMQIFLYGGGMGSDPTALATFLPRHPSRLHHLGAIMSVIAGRRLDAATRT